MKSLNSANQSVYENLWDSRSRTFSADMLKLTALVTMLLDHIGAGIIGNLILTDNSFSENTLSVLINIYQILRLLGRISFPIFCFLLVQGFLHTHSRPKYAGNLLLFALISELPFDYLFFGGFTLSSQNVFWTLFIGLLTLWCMENAEQIKGNILLRNIALLLTVAAGAAVSILLSSDYSWMGILLIACLYLFRKNPALQCSLSCGVFVLSLTLRSLNIYPSLSEAALYTFNSEWTVMLAFLMIYHCNQKRYIKGGKYIFYAFYPLHLLILALLLKLLLFLC